MSAHVLLPDEFGYVPASLLTLGWVLLWQMVLVRRARTRAGISYPQLYAEQEQVTTSPTALRFNCTQRAHQNTLEIAPIIAISTLVCGLKFPRAAAMMCGVFVIGRIIFTLGYKTGNPRNRLFGVAIGALAMIGLLGSGTYVAYLLWPSA